MARYISRRAAALSLAAILLPAGAGALSFKHLFRLPLLTFSPDSVVQGSSTIRVSAEGYAGTFAIVFTQLSLAPTPAAPAEGLRYGLFQPAGTPTYELSITGAPASSKELILGSFAANAPKNATTDVSFAALVSPLSLPPPGSYVANLKADLYASSYPLSGAPVDSLTFSVSVTVGSFFDVSLAPSGGSFSLASTSVALAFGVLAGGDSRGLDVLVRSNLGYSMTLGSANGGALANALDGSLLGYGLAFGGRAVSLSPGLPAPVVAGAAPTYSSPARYGLAVTISPFVDLPTEGSYSDALTISVSAP